MRVIGMWVWYLELLPQWPKIGALLLRRWWRRRAAFEGLPTRWLYPLLSPLLAAALCLGLALLRTHGALAWARLAGELRGAGDVYGYLALCTLALSLPLGALLGGREDRLRARSLTDPVTEIANRACFEERFARELGRAASARAPLSLLVIDVDRLKDLNDRYGHAVGDELLRRVGRLLRRSCRARDLVARWGGDEFAVVAPRTAGHEAVVLARRLREQVRALARSWLPEVSISIGVADLQDAGASSAEALFLCADKALYLAKKHGRDLVVRARPAHPEGERSPHVRDLDLARLRRARTPDRRIARA